MSESPGTPSAESVDPAPPAGAKTWNVEHFDGQRWIGLRFRVHEGHAKRYHSTDLFDADALDELEPGTYRVSWRGADSRTVVGHSEPFVVEEDSETPRPEQPAAEEAADADETPVDDELPPLGPVPITADVPDELLAMDRGIHLVLRIYQMLQRDTRQHQQLMTNTFKFAIEAERKRTQEFLERVEGLHRREQEIAESDLLERLEKLEASGDLQAVGLTPEAQQKVEKVVAFLKPLGEALVARMMQGQVPSEQPGGNTNPDAPSS